jgi:hypothetical protein
MRRFSIAGLMGFGALCAPNLLFLRDCFEHGPGDHEARSLLVGLMPPTNVLIATCSLVAPRYRISLRGYRPGDGPGFVISGPLRLLSINAASSFRRLELVITPRVPPCDASPSSA